MTREESIAASLLAADDEVSIFNGVAMINDGRSANHAGDCTKQPWTCIRCRYEDYVKFAARLEDNLKTFGLGIESTVQ
jgi:hypothetical protein